MFCPLAPNHAPVTFRITYCERNVRMTLIWKGHDRPEQPKIHIANYDCVKSTYSSGHKGFKFSRIDRFIPLQSPGFL